MTYLDVADLKDLFLDGLNTNRRQNAANISRAVIYNCERLSGFGCRKTVKTTKKTFLKWPATVSCLSLPTQSEAKGTDVGTLLTP